MGDNPRLVVHEVDARPFLRSTDERYDLIVVDAYRQPYVPFYLATREFFRLVRDHLTPGGIVALNVADGARRQAAGRRSGRDARAPISRRSSSGPRFASTPSCSDSPSRSPHRSSDAGLRTGRASWRRFARCSRATHDRSAVASRPWTDDRAPVEWLTDRMIVSYAAQGGRLEEDYLPTRPTP